MKKKLKLSFKGFTLIEIMIVMLIIGVIATLTMSALSNNRVKSRDLKRVSGINSLQAALDVYYKDHGVYPTIITPGMPLKSADGSVTYIDEVPSNPQPRNDNGCPDSDFIYTIGPNNKTYSLAGCIGDEKNSGKPKLIYGTREAIFHCGDNITDRDGFTYKTVSIGTQCWMAENLKTRTNPDGTCINISMISPIGGYFFTVGPAPECKIYNNGVLTNLGGWGDGYSSGVASSKRDCISTTADTQGTEADCVNGSTLYTWRGAMGDTPSNPIILLPGVKQQFKRQGICPDGWRIPSHDDFTTLERTVCTSATCATDFPYSLQTFDPPAAANWRGTNEAFKLIPGGSAGFNFTASGQRRVSGSSNSYTRGLYLLIIGAQDTSFGTGMLARRQLQSGVGAIERRYTDNSAAQPTAYGVRCVKE